jgi:hypothetical protein
MPKPEEAPIMNQVGDFSAAMGLSFRWPRGRASRHREQSEAIQRFRRRGATLGCTIFGIPASPVAPCMEFGAGRHRKRNGAHRERRWRHKPIDHVNCETVCLFDGIFMLGVSPLNG